MRHVVRTSTILVIIEKAAPVIGALSLGLVLAALLSSIIQSIIIPVLGETRIQKAVSSSPVKLNISDVEAERIAQLRALSDKNPFSVLLRPAVIDKKVDLPPEDERVFSVDGIKVVGSLPGVAAWLSEKEKVSLVLQDQSYGGFVLKEISPYSVVLSKDNVNYQVYISYRDQGKTASSQRESQAVLEVASSGSSMVQAASNESEGVVARELVDSLLMNPFDELKRVRLIAKFVDGTPVGIEVANIMDGSVLKELGVQKGDVVKSVNGVVIRNMGDVANAINSLMGGSRFEVSVGRGDQDVMLNYVVK